MNTVARTIELGRQRNMTLFQLARFCDVPYSTLKNAEIRNGQLSVDVIERICDGLGIPLAKFFEASD